jgi:hypothetical protein
VRSIEKKTHENTAKGASDGDGGDPRKHEETNSLPVDSLEGTVAETDTYSGTSNAHGGGDWKRVLGEDENSDGSTHFHGGASAWRVIGELVTHDWFL